MKIIVFTRYGHSRHVNLAHPLVWGGVASMVLLLAVLVFWGGYYTARHQDEVAAAADPVQRALKVQADEIQSAKQKSQAEVDALSAKVAGLQAHIMRLDAMGAQLTSMAGLKHGEFDFNKAPPEGGPMTTGMVQHTAMPDFLSNLDQLSAEVKDREQQLGVLENLMVNRNVRLAAQPAGAPITGGYVSSLFGMRIDPFTGQLSMHPGIDFAGIEGQPVDAVAAGVVTWAGDRSGYGNLVEIDHGNGYATRYGHNETILVHVGQVVKKGQVIALLGSTGRSTGPHVHFEVLYNGQQIDPARFVKAAGGSQVAVLSRNLD